MKRVLFCFLFAEVKKHTNGGNATISIIFLIKKYVCAVLESVSNETRI
jgi:hypothetical protein